MKLEETCRIGKKGVVALALATGLLPLFADVMDKKAAVIKTVETAFAGTAEVTCDDTKGWTFDVSASVDDGRDVVTVRLSRADDAAPPRFSVFFRVSGAGVQNVWTSNHEADGTHLWPRLWWGWNGFDGEQPPPCADGEQFQASCCRRSRKRTPRFRLTVEERWRCKT